VKTAAYKIIVKNNLVAMAISIGMIVPNWFLLTAAYKSSYVIVIMLIYILAGAKLLKSSAFRKEFSVILPAAFFLVLLITDLASAGTPRGMYFYTMRINVYMYQAVLDLTQGNEPLFNFGLFVTTLLPSALLLLGMIIRERFAAKHHKL